MAEYIDREKAIKAAIHAWAKGLEPTQYIDEIPAADVAPVVHAHWAFGDNNERGLYMICSNCGFMFVEKERTRPEMLELFQGCPACRAKMDEASCDEV